MIKIHLFLSAQSRTDPFALRGDSAARQLEAICPGVLGYVQSRALPNQLDGRSEPLWVGIAEIWFREEATALGVCADIAVLSPLWCGEAVSVAALSVGEERVVTRRPEYYGLPYIKGVFPFRRASALSVAEFQRVWWHEHGPVAARTEGALAYLQYHPVPASYAGTDPAYDGVTELYWPDVAVARAAMASRQMREEQAADALRFVEPGSVSLVLVAEERVLPP